jgi:hypothetical protein
MQQATGPNFFAARAKAASSAVSEEMSQEKNWKVSLSVRVWGARKSRQVTRASAARRAVTVEDPMKPIPPVIKTCVPVRLRDRSIAFCDASVVHWLQKSKVSLKLLIELWAELMHDLSGRGKRSASLTPKANTAIVLQVAMIGGETLPMLIGEFINRRQTEEFEGALTKPGR